MKEQIHTKSNSRRSWSFVAVQAVILGLLVFLDSDFGPSVSSYPTLGKALEILGWIGILVSAFNIRTVLTAEPLPRQNGKLSTGGLYKYVRHPMYTSVLTLALGIAVLGGSLIKYGLVVGLYLLFHFKAKFEEKYLAIQYKEYEEYADHTPRFIPFIK